MEIDNLTIVTSIILALFGCGLTILVNTLLRISDRLSEIHHAIQKGEINPSKFNEVKEEIIELKGMLNMLTLNRNQRDPPI